MRRGWILALILLPALFACEKVNDPEPEKDTARLRSVTVLSDKVVLKPGGSATFSFSVEDIGYAFDPARDVALFNAASQVPEEFSLGAVTPVGNGTYSAQVADNGGDNEYNLQVRLGIRQGKEAYVFSAPFTVCGKDMEAGIVLHTGLPTIYLNTQDGAPIVSKTDTLHASLTIRGVDEDQRLDEVGCSVRGRGNTTWWWPKKPYLIKLNKKAGVFGMPKHKRWILLANFLDRTMMRNIIAMKVASMTSLDWTPGCRSVELVLNGKHMGNYLLIEQVKVDKKRVPVTEMTPDDNAGEAVTGGYLLELDFHYDNEVQWVDSHGGTAQWGAGSGIPFGIKYPDPEDLTPAQESYIKKYIAEAAEALYGPDFTDPEKGYAKYIDVDSFVDYWIVFEVMGNHELGNPGSVYFHKDRGGKLMAGPCWDFDWGILSYNTSPHARTGLINRNAIWYARLFQDPAFVEKVKSRFQELLPQFETIPDFIDETEKLLTESARLNFQMWNPAEDASQNGGRIINGDENMSFHDAVARIRSIFQDRLTVIPESL